MKKKCVHIHGLSPTVSLKYLNILFQFCRKKYKKPHTVLVVLCVKTTYIFMYGMVVKIMLKLCVESHVLACTPIYMDHKLKCGLNNN